MMEDLDMNEILKEVFEEREKLQDDKRILLDLMGYMAIKYLPEADIASFVHCIYNDEYDVIYKYLGVENKQN